MAKAELLRCRFDKLLSMVYSNTMTNTNTENMVRLTFAVRLNTSYDVISSTAKTVTLRARRIDYSNGVRDEHFDTGAYGQGVISYPTVSDPTAPLKRIRRRADGTFRVYFTNTPPRAMVDNRL